MLRMLRMLRLGLADRLDRLVDAVAHLRDVLQTGVVRRDVANLHEDLLQRRADVAERLGRDLAGLVILLKNHLVDIRCHGSWR